MRLLMSSTTNEWVKMSARKKTVFFLLLTALLPVLGMPVVLKLQSGLGITAVAGSQYPITVLNFLTLFVLPLMIFMSVSDTFSGEFGDRTIRSVLVRPVDRFKIFSSKLLAVFALISAGLLLGLVSSVISSMFLPASESVVRGIAQSALAYAAAAVPMFVLGAAAVFLAQFFKNASGALAICILVYTAAKLIALVFPQYTVFLPTAYTDWHQLWIGNDVSAGKIFTIFSFLLGCGIVFYTSALYVFDKKEV